jgi:hypothetical protein
MTIWSRVGKVDEQQDKPGFWYYYYLERKLTLLLVGC